MRKVRQTTWDDLSYDPETGFVSWVAGARKGQRAGCVGSLGYREIKFRGRRLLEHRVAWFIYYGQWPKKHLDHADGDRANNKLANLREATKSQNRHNTIRVRNGSGYMGVCWNKKEGKWQASIGVNRRKIYLGLYDDPEEAGKAYREAAKKHFGEFAR